MQRPFSQPAATTNGIAPPEGEALLRAVVGALARASAREAFAAVTKGTDTSPPRDAGPDTASP